MDSLSGLSASGYGNTVLGALTVAAVAGIAWCARNKFKHSKCAIDSGCLKLSSREDDETRNTIRNEILEELRREGVIPRRIPARGEDGPTRL